MTTTTDRPADTRMMTVVHDALRRDLARATTVLGASPAPDDDQLEAIARHLAWMMGFLHAHHHAEDTTLYPVVRDRCPDAAALLDQMAEQHDAIGSAIGEVEAAAGAIPGTDAAADRERLAAAVADLQDALLPHLAQEEAEAMPVVSRALTHAEWQEMEQQANVSPKDAATLAKEGHWLIDDASPEDRALVLGLVSPVTRVVLLYGFARSYRRLSDACWHPARRRRAVQRHGRVEVVAAADAEAVWEVIRDVTRVGEWSHECTDCSYVGGATRTAPGVRFRGRNRQGIFRWGRECEVLGVEDHELVWRTVPTALYPDSTVWRLRVEATDEGARIEQRFDVVRGAKALDVLYSLLVPAHRDRRDALVGDLRRLAALAEDPSRVRAASGRG